MIFKAEDFNTKGIFVDSGWVADMANQLFQAWLKEQPEATSLGGFEWLCMEDQDFFIGKDGIRMTARLVDIKEIK